MAPEVYDAIVLCRESIQSSAKPRLFEELLKVLRSGASRRWLWLAWETGLLHEILARACHVARRRHQRARQCCEGLSCAGRGGPSHHGTRGSRSRMLSCSPCCSWSRSRDAMNGAADQARAAMQVTDTMFGRARGVTPHCRCGEPHGRVPASRCSRPPGAIRAHRTVRRSSGDRFHRSRSPRLIDLDCVDHLR